MSLEVYRRMGSMEQLFVCLNYLKLHFGSAVSMVKINGLSQISTSEIQAICNKLYKKYESLQCQILTVDNQYEFDWIYIGCLPFDIIRYQHDTTNQDYLHKLYVTEINHRFLLLNDCNLTTQHITNKNYNINTIPPLYRVIVYNDYIFINVHHAIADGMSHLYLVQQFIGLLNNDQDYNDQTIVKYDVLEEHINPKYAASPFLNKMINYFVPTSFAMWFSKIYANNSFLSKYNPLSFHNDDILRFQYMYNYNNMLSFPLKRPYNKADWNLDYILFKFNKKDSLNIIKQCKLHKVHMSSLMLYIITAAMIECHSELLNKDYYKTVVGNMYSAVPLFRNTQKKYFGMNAVPYNNVVEYYRNIKISSDKFWSLIGAISEMLLDVDDNKIVNVFKNKFPFLNTKKWIRYNWDHLLGKVPMGPPTISNFSLLKFNKSSYKYKIKEYCACTNPAVGFGAPYIFINSSVKDVAEMTMCFSYGTQFITKELAQKIVKNARQKFATVASASVNYQSKL